MPQIDHYATKAQKRARRVRAKVRGTSDRPRLTVFCSNRHTFVQVINDETGQTLASANELQMGKTKKLSGTKLERAKAVAEALAADLKKQKITKLAFDRGARRYHGRVKAVAEAMRAADINV